MSHGVENYFPRLWGTGTSDAIFCVVLKDYIKIFRIFITQDCLFVNKFILLHASNCKAVGKCRVSSNSLRSLPSFGNTRTCKYLL